MANIMDYLMWRGDLSFKASPFNEVDNLILTQLAFFNFDEVMEKEELLTLREAEKRFFEKHDKATFRLGLYFPPVFADFLTQAAESVRFGDLLLYAPENVIDAEQKLQFGAVTFVLPDKTLYCAFRGTDDRLLSWYESLSLGVFDELPIHGYALRYLDAVTARFRFRRFFVGGHSKGGHLATYAASKLSRKKQKRLLCVYNNDGPGFRYEIGKEEGYRAIASRVRSVTPYMSIVGAMLNHAKEGDILESDGEGVFQHDAFNWHVTGNAFVRLTKRSEDSYLLEKSVKGWLGKIEDRDKERFLNAIYTLLTASGAQTLSEISEDKLGSAYQFGKTLLSFDKDTREVVSRAVMLLLRERKSVQKEGKAVAKQMKKQKKASDTEKPSASDTDEVL